MSDPQPSSLPPNGSQEQPIPPETDSAIKPDPELDASIEQDIDMTAGQTAAGENPDEGVGALDPIAAAPEPSKKETSLREFLGKMDDYAPIKRKSKPKFAEADEPQIPDAVTAHYLTLAGLPPPGTGPNQTPPHLARLLALATQKFVSDIAADSYQFARIRASNSSSANNPMGSLTAASGLGGPAGAGAVPGGVAGGDGGKGGKGNTHLGIQRPGFGGGGSGGSGQGRTVLTMEDLGMAVSEYGVTVKRGEFYR
ncbi:Transcription initiation factor TFIID 23-30kDa subunit [Penicillium capsulatum]|uniref:Transcription initiation factor TFIID 23-30kDa subunit n=1 Tax=Penicillium capsulatum TaxID=69766 RepID=A0A9W9I381_9EURO|nr:Transcription initiation factor TFIID 23-30kDa subunit [Penicillium capsulatum]KAJ6108724.1 Transcription initiation factor TFIID 23-30kDa subunit [Penicillium capsulatum]